MTAASSPVASPAPLDRLRAADPLTATAGASLLALLLISNDDGWILGAVGLTCLIALPRPVLLRSPWFWAALFMLIGARQIATWHTIDDHTIAMTYWCGALALALGAAAPRATLAASARCLIGSLFAFAAGWKLLSGQFVDGAFFRYSLLFDDRFEVVARVLGGTTEDLRTQNLDSLGRLITSPDSTEVGLVEGSRNEVIAQAFTWWGILIETAVAVTFLAPLRSRWVWLRHAALVAFAGTTYLVVPIGGFGTFLLVLGSTMVATDRARLGYYAGAAVLVAWAGVWPLLFG